MKRTVLLIALGFLLLSPAFAASEAVVQDVYGRVELRYPGGQWEKATPGMQITPGTVISTGFDAGATLLVGESVLTVRQLTRMRLEELLERDGLQKTELFLQIGKVRAEIKTAAGLKHDFLMKSPICTAAVRGTIFDFDTVELDTLQGLVVMTNPAGMKTFVAPGESGSSSGGKKLENAVEKKEQSANVNYRAGGVKRKVGQMFAGIDRELLGSIKIVWTRP